MEQAVTPDELAVVTLIAEGLTRWRIAERLELNEDTVRKIVRQLCTRFDCPMRDLPDAIGLTLEEEDE